MGVHSHLEQLGAMRITGMPPSQSCGIDEGVLKEERHISGCTDSMEPRKHPLHMAKKKNLSSLLLNLDARKSIFGMPHR